MRSLALLVALTLLSGCGIFGSDDPRPPSPPLFTQAGSPPGTSTVRTVFAGEDGTLFASTPRGLYRRSSGETTFAPLGNADVEAPVVRTRGGALYIGVNKGGIRYSGDGGQSWRWLGDAFRLGDGIPTSFCPDEAPFLAGRVLDVLDLYELADESLVAATECGLLYWRNGHWRTTSVDRQRMRRVVPVGGSLIALGREALYRSADGLTWTHIAAPFEGAGLGAAFGSTLVVRHTDRTFWISADEGLSWQRLNVPVEVGHDTRALVADAAGVLYAGGGDGLWRSADGGGSWEAVALSGGSDVVLALHAAGPTLWVGLERGLYEITGSDVAPLSLGDVVLSSVVRQRGYDVVLSEAYEVWTRSTSGEWGGSVVPSFSTPNALAGTPEVAYAASPPQAGAAGLLRSRRAGEWVQTSPPVTPLAIAASGAHVAVSNRARGEVAYSRAYGDAWARADLGASVAQLAYDDQQTLYALSESAGGVYQLIDGVWSQVAPSPVDDPYAEVRLLVWGAGEMVAIARSTVWQWTGRGWADIGPRGGSASAQVTPARRPDGSLLVAFDTDVDGRVIRERSPEGAWSTAAVRAWQVTSIGVDAEGQAALAGPDGLLTETRLR
jgi:hypothetical protein